MVAGIYKSMPDGPEQRKRDRKMAARMDRKNPKYEFWRAGGGLNWLYGYRFLESVSSRLACLVFITVEKTDFFGLGG